MVNVLEILTGTGVFILGYFIALMSQYILPPLIDLLGDTTGGIVWFGLIIVWTLLMFIIPLGLKVHGLTKSGEGGEKFFEMIFGLLYSLFALGIFYFGWYWTTTLTGALTYSLLIGLFWIGVLTIFIFDVIVVPVYLITQAKRG